MTAVLLDIEGTTTSISFVFDVLFPYAAKAIPDFMRTAGARPELAETIALIRKDALPAEAALDPVAGALAVVQRQMAGDVKATGLKQLQGLVWRLENTGDGDFTKNGELSFLKSIGNEYKNQPFVFFDIGANIGEYTEMLFKCSPDSQIKAHLFN